MMKTTIRTILLAAVALLIVQVVKADDKTARSIDSLYRAGEVNIEAGYILGTEDLSTYDGATYIGGNYMLTKNAGLHLGAICADENKGNFVRGIEFGLLGRLPWHSVALEFGTGAQFALKPDEWAVYAEAGPRFRVSKHIDIFAKVRGVRPISGAEHEHVELIGGIGFTP